MIYIEVSGGTVTRVTTDEKSFEVQVINYDNGDNDYLNTYAKNLEILIEKSLKQKSLKQVF
jgi:hypothetical protein